MNSMTSSSKFEFSSSSPDGLYPSGQRGSYATASLDRLGSFREGMENRALALPSMSRSASTLYHAELMNFLQSLPSDAKVTAAEQKFPRQGELKRALTAALGISPGDSSSSSFSGKPLPASSLEEIRRVKASLHDNSIKASDRVKIWNEAISKIDKYCQSGLSKKRSKPDVSSGERLNVLLLGDRLASGGSAAKVGSQSHLNSGGFELGPQKPDDRARNVVPNRRVRSSMADVRTDLRTNSLVRPSGPIARDRDLLKLANVGTGQTEEKNRTLTTGVDGWEKSKMKKKRSGIKSDVSTSGIMPRPLDGDHEPKRGVQQRLGSEARSKLTNAHGFRPTICEDSGASSPTSIMKMSASVRASVRAPRSSAGALPKASPVVHRAIGNLDDWDHSQSTSKLHSIVGANNRKRSTSAQSLSPPVAKWAGQRQQKMSRVARRTNLVPVVSSHDEAPAADSIANVAGAGNGLGFPRRLSGNAFQQVKLKGDQMSSAAQSESEESGATVNKSKGKGGKAGEMDEKAGPIAAPAFPRKNKVVIEEGLGHVVRRQGRTVRGFAPTRSIIPPTVEKLDNVATANPIRAAKFGSDKIESRAGRPPSKKVVDRKAYTCPRNTVNGGSSDFTGESGDDHQELLAAVNAALNASHACSSPFWKQVEPVFGFVTGEDMAFLKQEIRLADESAADNFVPCVTDPNSKVDLGPSTPALACRNDAGTYVTSIWLNESERDAGFDGNVKHVQSLPDQFVEGLGAYNLIPLSLRVVAAAMHADEVEELYCDVYDSHGIQFGLDAEFKSQCLSQWSLENFPTIGRVASNGYRVTATRRYLNELELTELECDDVMTDSNNETLLNMSPTVKESQQPKHAVTSSVACSKLQYEKLSFDDRILLELQSIGISLESVGEDCDIGDHISRLEEKLHEQAMEKKNMLIKLEKAVMDAREVQERGIEQSALDKLVIRAYEKYMACQHLNASGGKSASNKITKRIASAFVKRVLGRCQKFEETGRSCFSEAAFRDMFLSLSLHNKDIECMDNITDGEAANPYADTPAQPSEVRTSAPLASDNTSMISRAGHKVDMSDKYSSDGGLPEQTFIKEDIRSNRVKYRELLLGDIVGSAAGSLGTAAGLGSSLVSGAKGKRSERDRDGKAHNRDLSRNSTAKVGRPSLSNMRGERKSKARPKQKTTQLSASVNGLLEKAAEQPKPTISSVSNSCEFGIDGNTKKKDKLGLDSTCDEAIDLSHLQIPEMDALGVPEAQDFGAWLNNIDDDGLQDHEFMGLDIPMDDLSDLNMMV